MLRMFPLLLIVVVIYNILVFGHGLASHGAMEAFLAQSSVNMVMKKNGEVEKPLSVMNSMIATTKVIIESP